MELGTTSLGRGYLRIYKIIAINKNNKYVKSFGATAYLGLGLAK
jgi:hypothetical protein